MRRINLVFLTGLLTVTLLGGVAINLVHGFQIGRHSSALLRVAHQTETQGNLLKTADLLARYLRIRPLDGQTMAWYARTRDTLTPAHGRRNELLEIFEEALRLNPGDRKLERRCAEIAMEPAVRRFQDAIRHLNLLYEPIKIDPKRAVEAADLDDLIGQCMESTAQPEKAAKSYELSIKKDRTRVATYLRHARLLRRTLKKPEAADREIFRMSALNPQSALAHLNRYLYQCEFGTHPDEWEVARALELGPNEAEVLIMAAQVARQKGDLVKARSLGERGRAQHPDNGAFYQLLSGIELAESHLDRALAILRQGAEAVPQSVQLSLFLTELLIDKEKLDGDDGAKAWLERLRRSGLVDGYIHFLEARMDMVTHSWSQAATRLELARTLLRTDADFLSRVNGMLVDCYARLGEQEKRKAALQRATSGGEASRAMPPSLVQELERTGRLDEAMSLHLEMVGSRPESRLDLVRLLIRKNLNLPEKQRRWPEVERRLEEAARALPNAPELPLLTADLRAAQDRLGEAQEILAKASARDPQNLNFRLAMARIARTENDVSAFMRILDHAEKDLGPHSAIQLARLDFWAQHGGPGAQSAVSKLADERNRLPAEEQPRVLDRLAVVELRLGFSKLARQYWSELAERQPENLLVRAAIFDLALREGDLAGAQEMVGKMRTIEGVEKGTLWRFAQASMMVDQYRRDPKAEDNKRRIESIRKLATEISTLRPGSWCGPALMGQIAELQGTQDEAIEQYKLAVEKGDCNSSVVTRLFEMLYRKPGDPTRQLEELIRLLGNQGYTTEGLTIARAVDLIKRKGESSAELVRLLLPKSSADYSEHLMMGRVYMAAGKPQVAAEEFKRAVELGPGVPDTWLLYVQHLCATGQIDQAGTVIQAARNALPANLAALTLARCWIMIGDYQQADKFIDQARREHSDDPVTLRNLVLLYLGQGRLDEAGPILDAFERLANLPPDAKTWGRRTRAELLLKKPRLADHDQALKIIDENLKEGYGNLVDLRMKVKALAARPGRRREAIKILEDLVASANQSTVGDKFTLARLYLLENMADKYEAAMRQLVGPGRMNPPEALSQFIAYLLDRNSLDEAAQHLALLKAADASGLSSLELEARLLDLRNRRPDLLALLKKAGKEFPDQIGRIGDLLARFGFPGEAEQAYKEFIAQRPDRPERGLVLARFYVSMGRISQALTILTLAWGTLRKAQAVPVALAAYLSPAANPSQKRQVRSLIETSYKEEPEPILGKSLTDMAMADGHADELILRLRQFLAENPDDAGGLNNLAWVLALVDPPQTEEALKRIDHATEVHGSNRSISDTRSVIFIRAGRVDEAIRELQAAQAMPAQSEKQRLSLAVHLAWAHQCKGELDEARRLFQQAEANGYVLEAASPLERPFITRLRQELGLGTRSGAPSGEPAGRHSKPDQRQQKP